jgi:NAD(P)-dependent dehydrogenase (short-subunit alcohol dehydrogenase family)
MNTLKGKNAIVTGGGSGIGFAIAKALVAAEANVIIASRRQDVLTAAAKELNAAGKGKAVPVVCDIRKKDDVVALMKTAKKYFPIIDVLVNNSGLGVTSKIVDCTDEEWDLVLDTNLKGAFWLTREALPSMIAQRSGYIVNIASQAAKHGYANAGPYCASKFGLLGFSEALQEEVREYGIIVHALCPALVQVPTPKDEKDIDHGVLQAEDLASTLMFLLTQPKRIKYENIGLYRF